MNNKGVSAVIGVILMIAITVAIASVVYVYVSGMMYNTSPRYEYVVEGEVDYIYSRGLDNNTVIITNKMSYIVSNDLTYFKGIEGNDNIRFYITKYYNTDGVDFVNDWEYIS